MGVTAKVGKADILDDVEEVQGCKGCAEGI